MCNSMHIMSKEHWFVARAPLKKPLGTGLLLKAAGSEADREAEDVLQLPIGGYSGYFSAEPRSSTIRLLEVDNKTSLSQGSTSCERVTSWYCLFFAHAALDQRKPPKANKLPLKAGVKSYEN